MPHTSGRGKVWPLGHLQPYVMKTLRIYQDVLHLYHSSIIIHIEQSFCVLVPRWSIVWRLFRMGLPASRIASLCMHLHNSCMDNSSVTTRSLSPFEAECNNTAFSKMWREMSALRWKRGAFVSRLKWRIGWNVGPGNEILSKDYIAPGAAWCKVGFWICGSRRGTLKLMRGSCNNDIYTK